MSLDIGINLETHWHKVPTDGTKCEVCKDIIAGDMWQLFIFVSGDLEPVETSSKLCDPCYSLNDK